MPATHVRASPAGAWLPAKGDVAAVVVATVGAVVAVSRWHQQDIAYVRAR